MGAADVVPGVSGGTIAFISGIYQELIDSIHSINLDVLKTFKKEGFKAAWNSFNGNFLLVLFLGILISVLSLARLITYLLHNSPILLWSFFFGLILASIFLIYKQISSWNATLIIALIISSLVSFYITLLEPSQQVESYGFIFLSGFIAIIAMILPGVSGAFILLLLGSYEVIIGNIGQLSSLLKQGDFKELITSLSKLITFGLGAVLGLKVFSGLLHWMFEHYKNLTLVVLTGFMVGSLNKIWPWKEVITTRINSKGIEVPLLEKSILPTHYEGDSQLMLSIILILIGSILIIGLDRISTSKSKNN